MPGLGFNEINKKNSLNELNKEVQTCRIFILKLGLQALQLA